MAIASGAAFNDMLPVGQAAASQPIGQLLHRLAVSRHIAGM